MALSSQMAVELELEPRPLTPISPGCLRPGCEFPGAENKEWGLGFINTLPRGDSPARARAGTCPSTFPPPGLAQPPADPRAGKGVQGRRGRKGLML